MINMIDEVTQFQRLAGVPQITEHYMVPVLEALVGAFPFRPLAFHADNGSEYVNHRVAAMLNKLHVVGVHEVPAPALERQHAGRVQERQRGAQVARVTATSRRIWPRRPTPS